MGNIRVSTQGKLFFDFYYRKIRCREYTLLNNNAKNRQRMERVLKKIEKEITYGNFDYREYFPSSNRAELFGSAGTITKAPSHTDQIPGISESINSKSFSCMDQHTPLFPLFADQWYKEKEVAWKRSQRQKVIDILNKHIIPRFRGRRVHEITKTEILNLRVYLAREYRGGIGLSPDRINQIMNILRQILAEAADRYDFKMPFRGIKPLKVPRTQVDPFSFEEVKTFLSHVPVRYRNYFTVAFFTGMRTSELIGLKKRYVDFDRAELMIRETFVKNHEDTPKTTGSERVIHMSSMVLQALRDEIDKSEVDSEFVFHGTEGQPLNYRNISNRIWYPTLEKTGLRRRRPYQTRHTAATLWLAAGENPEWVARQMGHTTTKMLFTVYSRYVPDLTRKDGSAIEQLLNNRFGIGD